MEVRRKIVGILAGGAIVLASLVAAPAAHAEEAAHWYSGLSCSSGRKVFTSSNSSAGYIYHYHEKSGTTYSKSWTNTTLTYRTWSKGFSSVDYAQVVAQNSLSSAQISCVA